MTDDPKTAQGRSIVRIAFSTHAGCDDWPTGGLTDIVAWFHAALEEIPVEFRTDAKCEIGVDHYDWGEYYPTIEISYCRPETAKEADARAASDEAASESIRQREVDLLRRLQEKYPLERGCQP